MILLVFAIMVVLFVVLPVIGMTLWALLSTVVVGLIIGALGRLVVPGRQPIGMLSTVLAGLSGSILGGFVGQHVLALSGILTVLIEIGIAAAVVAVLARSQHLPRLPGGRRPWDRSGTGSGFSSAKGYWR
jgi:uncharacterized membrane protein YeaQ/YmgE (transglycosylase-associated protein family)